MKKILSFLLAASLVLGFSAVGFAADGEEGVTGLSEATLAGVLCDGTIQESYTINGKDMSGYVRTLKSLQKPESAEFTLDGKPMEAEIESIEKIDHSDGYCEYNSRIAIGDLSSLDLTAEDAGTTLEGEIKVHWGDKSFSTWKIAIRIHDMIFVNTYLVDEQGNNPYPLRIGKTYIAKVVMQDANNRLKDSGIKKIACEWTVSNGAQRIELVGEPGGSPKDGESWMDPVTYEVSSGNGGEITLPFEMKFSPVASGSFFVEFVLHFLDSGGQETDTYRDIFENWLVGCDYTVIDTIEDGSDLIDIETDVDKSGPEIVVNVPAGRKISAAQFAQLQQMAQNGGKPVSLELEDTEGIQMKLDISGELPPEFLKDLAEKNNGKFDPSVNLNIPNGANRYVSAHGQWVDFMYSGRLPGRMTVTVDIPKGTFADDVNALTAWWYDESTHRASKQGVTVSFDKAAGTATFTIDHCSAWGLFPVGYNPNLYSDDDDSDSSSSSDSGEADFSWYAMRERVKDAKAGSTVRMGVPAGEKIPASLLRELAKKKDVTLVLRQNGKSLKIHSGDIGELEQREYRFSELQALFGGQTASGGESADADKTNPGTGASDHMGAALLLSACGLVIVRRLRG